MFGFTQTKSIFAIVEVMCYISLIIISRNNLENINFQKEMSYHVVCQHLRIFERYMKNIQ